MSCHPNSSHWSQTPPFSKKAKAAPKARDAASPKAKAEKPVKVPFDLIILDTDTQSRVKIDDGVVDEYASLGDMDPVTLFYEGKGSYWVGDGWHRIQAAIKRKAKSILAVVKLGGKREAILHSAGANASHGLRRTNADKRKAILTLLNDDEWRGWTDSEIARRCGVHQTTVSEVRRSISPKDSLSEDTTRKYVDKHGNVTEMKTSAIGRKPAPTPEVPENQPEGTVGHTHGATSNLTLEESPDGTGLGKGVDPDGGVTGDGAGVAGPESPGAGDAKGDDAQKATEAAAPTSLPDGVMDGAGSTERHEKARKRDPIAGLLAAVMAWQEGRRGPCFVSQSTLAKPTHFPWHTHAGGLGPSPHRARVRVLSPTATRCLDEPQCVARPGCSVMPLAGRCVVRDASGQQCPGFRLSARLIQVLASPAPSAAC